MNVEWIEHKGKKILFVDYGGAKNDAQLIELLNKEVEIERAQTEKILCLVSVKNAHAGKDYMAELKRLGKEVRNVKVEKTATLGIDGLKKILFNAYVAFTGEKNKAFDDEAQAKDWLVE